MAVLLALALGVRVPPLFDQSLWTDELFSLAMATGHSVEHPAAGAQPALGDYVEPVDPVPAKELARYVEHDEPPAGPGRVVRAVRRSDANPPLYYLLLWAWTRLFGTGQAALRALSVAASVATIAILPGIARRCGGRRAVPPAVLLGAFAPVAVHYGTEGRMYAWLALFAAGLLRSTLALRRRNASRAAWIGWAVLATAGLLTHLYFLFPCAACVVWLLSQRSRVDGRRVFLASASTALSALAWYVRLPETLAASRLTSGWLDGLPPAGEAWLAPLRLAYGYVSGVGVWRGELRFERAVMLVVGAAVSALAISLLQRRLRRALLLPALATAAACVGPLAVDLLRDTHSVQIERYALAGLPAGLVVLAVGYAHLPRLASWIALIALIGLWTPALRAIDGNPDRQMQSYRALAAFLDARLGADDLIVAHTIPTCLAGMGRELDGPAPIFPWVEQLGVRRSPEDVERVVAGRRVVACVEFHTVGAATPACTWLERHATTVETARVGGAHVRLFALSDVAIEPGA